ncbi:uncharacterized protein LOC103997612 isoform X1 [Musa acuminata AAA Group]|uniref:uncharacterized protein LOC103997612 isoform X1 n=2 Tax=Musa acuminata AAA Group TaxID=214697 RepID=UPI0031D976E8
MGVEETGGPAAPLLPQPTPPQSAPPCYGVPVAAAAFQDPYFPDPPAYVLLPVYPRRRRQRCGCFSCCGSLISSSSTLLSAAFFLVLLSSAFFLWPSDPVVTVTRFHLEDIRVTPPPLAAIGISLRVDLRVRNPDFFSLDHRSIVVSIGYRGRPLGSVTANGGHIKARGVSHVHAKLKIDGIRVWSDAIYLIEDLARRSLPLDTVTEVDGRMRLFFVDLPVQGKISCSVSVNPETREVINQDCYPEVSYLTSITK